MEIREYGTYILVALSEDDDRSEFAEKLMALHKENPRQIIVSLGDGNMDDLLAQVKTATLNEIDLETSRSIAEFLPPLHTVTALCRNPGWKYPTSRILSQPKDPSKGLAGMPRKRGKGRFR